MVVFLGIAVLLQIFAHAVASKSKSVNLALETVLEFDKYNLDSDVKIIDNVQRFLTKVRNVLDANRASNRRRMGSTPYLQFTDFLHTCIETLKTYNDEDLQEFAVSFDEEIRKYHYKGCKFYELLENNDARQIISHKFQEFRSHSPKKLRKVLNKVQKKILNTKSVKGKAIIDLINSLYRIDSQNKFKTFIDNLEAYKTKPKDDISIDISKIIKNGIRALLFDHYSNLNLNVRQDVKGQINEFINPDKKSSEGNGTIIKELPKWDIFYKPLPIDDKRIKPSIGEIQFVNDEMEEDNKKHTHSKQLNQVIEHDIEADVTNKWLFEEITTAKYKKKKLHRHGKHDNSKSNKKHKKHKKKKAKSPLKKKAITTQPLNILFRMTPGVEGRHLPEKKETTKFKTIMKVREDKPLSEIFSENAAEIFISSDRAFKNARPPLIMNKILPMVIDQTPNRFRAAKSSEMSHSEQDKKDGLSIEGWRREGVFRRNHDTDDYNAVGKQAKQQVAETRTTSVDTTIDPIVLKKIHNLEEELLHVKKRMREQKTEKLSTSGSSESDTDDSDDQKTVEVTKSSIPMKTTISSTVTSSDFPTTTTTVSTTTNQKITWTTETSSESSSSETEENQDSTNATPMESTVFDVELKTLTSEKKSPPTPTTSLTTTLDPPIINTTLIDLDRDKNLIVRKKEDSSPYFRSHHQGIIPVRERTRDDNSKDLKRNSTSDITTEISQGIFTTTQDVFEVKFNIKHDGTFEFTKIEPTHTTTSKPLETVFKNDTSSKVKTSTRYSKQTTDIPDIVDVISVLNSTMSTQEKLKKLQSLRRKIDLMSDEDANAISRENPTEGKS